MAKKSAPKKPTTKAKVCVRPLTSADWPVIERLFGANGACGGCWCMWWRVPRGGKLWEENKGEPNKRAFKKLVAGGHVTGVLAFADDEPVGWCCVGPRADFPRLERTKALARVWDKRTWCVTCFYIKSAWRHRGVASALLKAAADQAKAGGAARLDGYPVTLKQGEMPGTFAWTGVPRLFEKARFKDVTPPGNSRKIFEKRFRSSGARS